jgi:hypothetical protein
MIRHDATVCRETQVDVLFSSMERHCGAFGQFADPGYAITVGQTQIFYEPYLSVLRAGR